MPAIPSGTDARDATARQVHTALPSDFRHANPVANGKSMLVPFGTYILTAGNTALGTVKSGTIDDNADAKERGDGSGGVEAMTQHKLRFECDLTATFRIMHPSSAPTDPTAGTGPIKTGDLFTLQVPKQGAACAAPATDATPVATFEALTFTVTSCQFKFSDGEYAEYSIKGVHHRGLHDQTFVSAEVTAAGAVVQLIPVYND
jgi:hypothetical protein